MQTALLLSRRRFRSSSLLYRYRVSRLPFSSSKPDNKNDEDVNVIKKAWRVIIRDKHIYTIPNAITMSRICASPFLAVAVATDMKLLSLGGCIIFCFSDWLDGYLAQKLHQRTILGAFLDPLADKCMVASLTVGLCWKGLMPLPLTCLIVGRDLVLTGITFAIRAKERAPGAPFFDTKDSATFDITPSLLSKVNTGLQMLLLSATLSHDFWAVPMTISSLEPLHYIVAFSTVGSALGYLDGSGIRRIKEGGSSRNKGEG